MIALCAEHANKADHGAFIDDQLRQLKAKTPEREDISGRFDWRRQDFLVRLGGNFYYRPVKIFEIGSVPCAWLTRDEEGLLEVNFRMPSIANEPRASVIENFWTAPRSADEIISPPMGRKIEVKYKNGDYFKIVFRNVKQPDHIGGLYPSANPGKLAGVVDFPTTLVEVTATVAGEPINFSPSHTQLGGLKMSECLMSDFGGAAAVHVEATQEYVDRLFRPGPEELEQ